MSQPFENGQVSAYDGEEIQRLGFDEATDVTLFTPGVNVSASFAGQFQAFSIRGVTQNDVLDHTEGPNAVYIDDGYVAALNAQSLSLFDVDAIEILKGPQGTLFGRNATGGAVIVRSNLPGSETNGYLTVNAGRYNRYQTTAAIGGPVSDKLGLRIAGVYDTQGDFVNNTVAGADDEGAYKRYGVRATAQLDPAEDLSIILRAYYTRQKMDSASYFSRAVASVRDGGGVLRDIVEVPFPTLLGTGDANAGTDFWTVAHDFSKDDVNLLRQYGATAQIDWDVSDAITLTSVTNYSDFRKRFYLESDGTEVGFLNTINLADTQTTSQELRLFGDFTNWRLNLGAYYLNIDNHIPNQSIDLPLLGVVLQDIVDLQTNSYSIFTQSELDLSDKLTLIAGLRYTLEEKDFDYESNTFVSPPTPTDLAGAFIAPNRTYTDDSSDDLYSARLQMDYHLTDDVLLYASFSRGVKAGSFNAPFGGSALVLDENIPYKSEILQAYETGFKSDLMSNRVRLNASAYYYDYQDYQAFRVTGITTEVVNADATYYGLEGELNALLSEQWSLFLSGSYVHTNVEDIDIDGVIADRKATFTPEWSASGILRYEDEYSFGQLGGQAEVNYNDSFFWNIANFSGQETDAHAFLNARLFYTSLDDRWTASLYAENITNERNVIAGFDFPDLCGCGIIGYGKPATYGTSLGLKF